MLKHKNKKNKGFTLIEFLIYSIIVTMFIGALILTSVNLIQGSAYLKTINEVNNNMRFSLNKITYYIHQANNFSITGDSLLLTLNNNDNVVIFIEEDILKIQKNEEDPLPLIDMEKIRVSSLSFTNISYPDSPKTIRIELSLKYYNPHNNPIYNFETTSITTENLRTIYPWSCGDDVIFYYNQEIVIYGTILSGTGRCWLDRNLGASQEGSPSSYDDNDFYGDLFQWGRGADGHQKRDSNTTSTLSSLDVPDHSLFITTDEEPYNWHESENNDLWQGIYGINNPCPSGFRVPTLEEWDDEWHEIGGTPGLSEFFNSLSITSAGGRANDDGSIRLNYEEDVVFGGYWASTLNGINNPMFILILPNGSIGGGMYRSVGSSVRCIMDQ